MKASHKKHTVTIGIQEIELKPGQFISGRKKAAEELNLGEQKVRTCFDFFQNNKNLTIKTTNKFSIITIVNWDTYQPPENRNNQQSNQQITNKQPTNNQQITTNKKGEKGKKGKNKEIPDFLDLDLWEDFRQHRVKLRAPMTERAEELAFSKLEKLKGDGNDPNSVIKQSIESGWKGLFPLKEENQGDSNAGRKFLERARQAKELV